MPVLLRCCGLLLLLACTAGHAANPLPLIPLPTSTVSEQGEFVVQANTPIRVAASDAAALQAAQYFSSLLQRTRGATLTIASTASSLPAIEFASDTTAPAGNEAYALTVTPARLRVRARNAAGLLYGGITLWQLLTADATQG